MEGAEAAPAPAPASAISARQSGHVTVGADPFFFFPPDAEVRDGASQNVVWSSGRFTLGWSM